MLMCLIFFHRYQEMLGKSDQHIESTKEKLHEMEAGFNLFLSFIAWLKHFTGHNHPVIIFCDNARVRSNCIIFVKEINMEY